MKDLLNLIINKTIDLIKYEIYMTFSEAIQDKIIQVIKVDPINQYFQSGKKISNKNDV